MSKMDLEMLLEEADVYDLPKLRSLKYDIESKIKELENRQKDKQYYIQCNFLQCNFLQWN